MTAVQNETGLARDQLYRLFPNNTRLLTEIYRRGHHSAAALCIPAAPRAHIPTFARAAIEQTWCDPVVAAMHALEISPIAAASALPSIYYVWEHWLTDILGTENLDDAAATASDARRSAADLAGVLVDALAGIICTSRNETGARASVRSLELVLRSLPSFSHR